jgi:hypothetical protein
MAQDFTQEWAGIWGYSTTLRDCDTGNILYTGTSRDTICPGDLFDPGDPEVDYNCTGTITGSTFQMTCTGSDEPMAGCTADYEVVSEGTRTGDSYTSNTTINT